MSKPVGQCIVFDYNTNRSVVFSKNNIVVYFRKGFMSLENTTPVEIKLINNPRFLMVTIINQEEMEWLSKNFKTGLIAYHRNEGFGDKFFIREEALKVPVLHEWI